MVARPSALSAADVHEHCVEMLNIMDVILFGSVELKVMVLLRTNMIPANAFVLLELCTDVHRAIERRLFRADASKCNSAVVLVNATVLLLNRWYRLEPAAARRLRFRREMAALVQRLEQVREELLRRGADDVRHCRFYGRFVAAFRTEPMR